MINDIKPGPVFFIAVWAILWLVLVSVASTSGDSTDALRKITPLIATGATLAVLGFKLYDCVLNVPLRLAALALLAVAVAAVNLFVSSRVGWPRNFFQELVNSTSILVGALVLREAVNSIANQRRARTSQKLAEQRASNLRLSPHVLHNLLNTIYAAALRDSKTAAPLILSLSAMMRYLTESVDREFVPAEAEREFIASYVALLRERLGEDHWITLEWPTDADIEIPPLICATLFENAVTHGELDGGGWRINVSFEPTPKGFRFSVENEAEFTGNRKQANADTGLKSVKERLQLLYPGQHTCVAQFQTRDLFSAKIETW